MSETIPQRCADHTATEKEILVRIDAIEKNVDELFEALKTTVNEQRLQDIAERSAREIKELKEDISKLSLADMKHAESLSVISEAIKSLKESQERVWSDTKIDMQAVRLGQSELEKCYNQMSLNINTLSTLLAERARVEGLKTTKSDESAVTEDGVTSKDPWFVRVIVKNPVFKTVALLFGGAAITFIFSHVTEIFDLLAKIFGSK
jgi:chromosome segregation ATPase